MATNNTLTKVPATAKASPQNFDAYLKQSAGAIRAVSAQIITPDRVARIALNCVSATPKLQDASVISVLRAVLRAAELGLEPGGALGHAYLVPYKGTCQLIVGYRGMIELARRSGEIKAIRARCVYKGDEFRFRTGLIEELDHVPATGVARKDADITHVWAVIEFINGGHHLEVMTKAEVDAIRSRSASAGNGPWVTDYAEMAKKTVLRRALKSAPMAVDPNFQKAMSLDTDAPAPFDIDAAIEPEEYETKTSRLAKQLDAIEAEATEVSSQPTVTQTVDPETGEVHEQGGLL